MMKLCGQEVEVGDLLLDDQQGIPYEIIGIEGEGEEVVIKVEIMDEEGEWQFTKKQVEGMLKAGFCRLVTNGSVWW